MNRYIYQREVKTLTTFEENKSFADSFIEQQREILNNNVDVLDFNKAKKHHMYRLGTPEEDIYHEADMIIFEFCSLKIALRVRNGHSYDHGDIAIRSKTAYGNRTELDKIVDGEGDYYLYCWTDDSNNISEYILFDLDMFRDTMDETLSQNNIPNGYGGAFSTFSIHEMLKGDCVVAKSLMTRSNYMQI